ncbi:alanine/glycine:cation symporter family protein [Tautonia plasticadhaerens]|uniref:Amino-acid carrier protein AlsT n=1 Tax=Tautonia plasticadhaerens TaxID=2527974 RepID=A0A518H132_9BACT|nr:amino acid carrier protein [Tautonia plasticadhaerens]QDV34523.1 Amino-acid carrier protein AlsT [Tautonia plasticadhaerens]
MDTYNRVMDLVIGALWSTPTFFVLLGTGVLFTVWSKFIQYRALTHGVKVLRGAYDDKDDPGAINHFQALSAALSGTVGLGNIGGVALAIGIGGPGALFWMWVTGFLGMAIKAVEVTLAMIYRDTSDPDNPHGGAMYVIKRGFGDRVGGWARPVAWSIGAVFCVTLLVSTMTGGNMFQAWNVASITNTYFGVPTVFTGVVLAMITGVVIIGGIKRIGDVAGRLVPFMCGLYLLAGVVVLIVKAADVPALLALVVREAFSPTEAAGSFIGATAWFGLTTGLRRALFSNEAGQGTSPIAHSAAKTDEPVREGVVAGLEPFIDTCLVCTLTALVILVTGTWNREAAGDFGGEIALVEGESGAFEIRGDTAPEHLPELPAPDVWTAGNAFFLVAEVEETSGDTGSNLVRVPGALVDDGEGGLRIAWGSLPAEAADGATLVGKGVYRDLVGAALTGLAYDRAIPGLGKWLVTAACWLFAISTLISWAYYGEQGVIYLFGDRAVTAYKLVFCLATVVVTLPDFIRTDTQLGNLADLGTGVMLVANVPIILAMGYQAMNAFSDYFARMRSGSMAPPRKTPPFTDVVEGRDVE